MRCSVSTSFQGNELLNKWMAIKKTKWMRFHDKKKWLYWLRLNLLKFYRLSRLQCLNKNLYFKMLICWDEFKIHASVCIEINPQHFNRTPFNLNIEILIKIATHVQTSWWFYSIYERNNETKLSHQLYISHYSTVAEGTIFHLWCTPR